MITLYLNPGGLIFSLQDQHGDKLVIKKAPPAEELHTEDQQGRRQGRRGSERLVSNATRPESPQDVVDVTLNPSGGGGVGSGSPGGPATIPQGSAAAASVNEDGFEGRPVVRYNPFGADARVEGGVSPQGVAETPIGGGGSDAEKKLLESKEANRSQVTIKSDDDDLLFAHSFIIYSLYKITQRSHNALHDLLLLLLLLLHMHRLKKPPISPSIVTSHQTRSCLVSLGDLPRPCRHQSNGSCKAVQG